MQIWYALVLNGWEKRRRNSASQMSLTFSGYVEKQ